MPPTDQAYSALLGDLLCRGMLDETLVVCMAEFGRTPEDHQRRTRSLGSRLLGRAGRRRRPRRPGRTARPTGSAAYPKEGRVRPEDLSATIFHCLGYSPNAKSPTPWAGLYPSAAAK